MFRRHSYGNSFYRPPDRSQSPQQGLPLRFSATKLIEGDEPLVKELELTANELDIIDHVTKDLEIALDTDKEAALADMRYTYIEELCSYAVHKPQETIAQIRSVKIDHYQ